MGLYSPLRLKLNQCELLVLLQNFLIMKLKSLTHTHTHTHMCVCATLVAQTVKNLTAKQTRVLPLGQENPLEKGMATDSSILSCLENPTDRGAWRATVHGVTKQMDTIERQTL